VIFAAAFFELCTHCCKPVLEDIDDRFADLGRRKGGSVYEPTPTIDFIFGADDHFIGVAIHPNKALGFLNPSHQIVDAHGLGLHWRPQRSNLAPFTPKAPQGFDLGCGLAPADHRTSAADYEKINADHTSLARRLLGARRPGAAGVPVLGVAAVH